MSLTPMTVPLLSSRLTADPLSLQSYPLTPGANDISTDDVHILTAPIDPVLTSAPSPVNTVLPSAPTPAPTLPAPVSDPGPVPGASTPGNAVLTWVQGNPLLALLAAMGIGYVVYESFKKR